MQYEPPRLETYGRIEDHTDGNHNSYDGPGNS